MTRFAVRALLAPAVLTTLLAGDLSAQPQVAGSVQGPDGKPLAAATVELLPTLPGFAAGQARLEGREVQPVAVSTSDDRGRFALSAPQEGIYKVRVAARGRVSMQSDPLALVEPTELPPVALWEDAGLALQITDSKGRPAAGVWVFASPDDAQGPRPRSASWQPDVRTGRTDGEGRLGLPRLPGERLAVTWFEPGTAAGSTRVLEGPASLSLESSTEAPRQIRVVSPEGTPLAGLLLRAGPQAWPVGLTDAEGAVLLSGGAGDKLDLRVTDPRGFSAPRVVQAPPGQPVTLRFPEPGSVAGQVRDAETGKPVAGALVWSPADPGAFARSGPDGHFQQRAPEPGTFWVEAAAPGYLPKRIQVTPAQVRSGRSLPLALTRAQRIRGQVVDPQGGAVEGAWIDAGLEHPGERPPSSGIETLTEGGATGPGGSFELRRLYPGLSYALRVQRPGYLPTVAIAVAPARGSAQAPVKVVLQPSPRVSGQVLDLQGRPVSGAEVEIALPSLPGGTAPLRATTDAKGGFSIAGLPALAVDLAVRKEGFAATAFRSLQLPSNRPAVDLGKILLRPGATLRGRLVDRQGRPVAAARIYQVDDLARFEQLAEKMSQEEPLGRSSSRGELELTDLPAGSAIHLLILAEGYRPEGLRAVRVPAAKPLVVTLTEAFTLHGRALDEKGEPVSGAVVEISVQEIISDVPGRLPAGKEVAKDSSTDREGRFTLAGFPAGDVEISLKAPGFIPITQKLVLPPAEPSAELTFTLQRGTELAGRVATADGRPVAGARIGVGESAARSDDDGFYQLGGLPLGQAEIELFHPHYPRQQKTEILTAGANRLDFRLPSGQEVSGAVLDEEGKPVAGAWVRLRLATAGKGEHSARSGPDGSFRLGPVVDGRYLVRATATGYAEGTLRQPLLVKGEPVEGVEVILPRGAALAGRIVGLDNEERWRLRVEAQDEEGRTYRAQLDTAGRYEIRNLPLGSWLIKGTLGSGERQVQARAELRQSGETVEKDLEFEDRLRLTGRVLFLDEPLADARVTLRAENRTVERAVLTDHQGSFEIEDLEPDTYRIGVNHVRRLVVHNGKLALTEDRDIVLDLQGATVRGTLADATTGKPIPNAIVSLLHQPGPDTAEFLIAGGTDETGAFTLPRVPPGRYLLRGKAEKYVPGEQAVEIPSQDEVSGLEMTLKATPGLEIAVRRTDGRIPPVVHFRAVSAGGVPDIAGSQVPDAQGRIRLPTPSEGSWLVWLGAPGCGTTKITAQAPGPPASAVLPPATRIAVRVPELATSDMRADVAVLGPDGATIPVLGPGGNLQQTWSTVGGRITIEDLPAGTLTVGATAGDGRSWSTTVVATEASSVAVTLQ